MSSKPSVKPQAKSQGKPKSTAKPPAKSTVNHTPVIIYSVLAVILIAYGVYLYFAMRGNYWPFHVYILNTSKMSPDVVQPNGNITYDSSTGKVYVDGKEDDDAKISEDDQEITKLRAEGMQQTNCNWYCSSKSSSGKNTFPLPADQKVLGDCDC